MSKQKKKRKQKKQPKVIKLSPEKVAEILGKLETAKVDADVTEIFKILIHENEWFFDQLEKGLLTIAKLRKLFDIQTEKINRNPRRNKPESNK